MTTVLRFFQDPGSSFFLFGPRGTGKSTWLRERYPDAVWLDLLAPEDHREYAARPERLRERIAASPEADLVVIDEIQKVPELLDVVHQVIESGRSARRLRKSILRHARLDRHLQSPAHRTLCSLCPNPHS